MITLELVRDKWDACYSAARLAALYDRPLTASEVLTRQDGEWATVPAKDRLWTVLRESVLPVRLLRLFAAACAEKACADASWSDPRSMAAIQAARDFAEGRISREDLTAARSAADAAAQSAADAATEAAAWSAAWSAADAADQSAAANAAARSAADAADQSAAANAAADMAREWQLQALLALMQKEGVE
jgi:hypothetical protein